jgi:glycosyltransferase involved in cell wall biosynthesis
MDDYPAVRRQAVSAAARCEFHVAISEVVRREIAFFADQPAKLRVIPDGIDPSVFTLPAGPPGRKKQILFVGIIRPVKGVDVLLKALRFLVDRGRDERLVLVGESFYPAYRREYERLRRMSLELGLGERVEFAGGKPIDELVRHMQESAVLVLPSRKESLGMVLVEALACGTPVVATRCGGPEDIVNDRVGILVPPEDPAALADGIERVLTRANEYSPSALRAYAVEKFSWRRVASQYSELYREAIARHGSGRRQGVAGR